MAVEILAEYSGMRRCGERDQVFQVGDAGRGGDADSPDEGKEFLNHCFDTPQIRWERGVRRLIR